MKKTLVALAALAATSAFAQSSVEVYGVVDAGLKNQTTRVNTTDTKTSAIGGGNQASSRLGFRGTEDIGGGMKAHFVTELGLKVTDPSVSGSGNAANSSTFDNRQTTLGLSGGFGSLTLGRMYTSTHAVIAATDAGSGNNMIGGATYVGGNSTSATTSAGGLLATPFAGNNAYAVRSNNAVSYVSPAFNGFKLGLGISKNKSDLDEVQTNTTGQSVRVEYANGPLTVLASSAEIKAAATLAAAGATGLMGNAAAAKYDVKQKEQAIGATYDLGVAKLFVNRLTTKADGQKANADFANAAKRTATEYGVQAPFGAVTAFAKIGTGKTNLTDGTDIALATDESFKFKTRQLGGSYAFSKRTNAYFIYGTAKADLTSTTDAKITATTVGLRHSF